MLCLHLFTNNEVVYGQVYFKNFPSTDLLEPKQAFFKNGDILIAMSSTESLHSGDETAKILLIRQDICGNKIWSKSYNYEDGYLVLKDVAINSNDEIYMFGSHFRGLVESVFLSKIEPPHEGRLRFRIYNPGTVDHFSFSIDANDNTLALYGLLFDFNTNKEGFVAYFDSNLNQINGIQFTPFESTGKADMYGDGDIVAWSGPYIYKFNENAELEWSYSLQESTDVQHISGPHRSNNGWVYEGHIDGQSFLYKIDDNGALEWTSDLFSSTNIGGSVKEMPDGGLSYFYNMDLGNQTILNIANISSTGQTAQETMFGHGLSINTGQVEHHVIDESILVTGNNNMMEAGNVEIENFIIKYPTMGFFSTCINIDPSINAVSNNYDLRLEPLEVIVEDFSLVLQEDIMLNLEILDFEMEDVCEDENEVVPTVENKLLPCAEEWLVALPSAEFQWVDGYEGLGRALTVPGVYTARNSDCLQQEVLEFSLEKEECGCEIYLPNTFSPNGDGMNDNLELGIFCDFTELEILIFNQWGERVFQSESNRKSWSGKFNSQLAPVGVYAAIVNYAWEDSEGKVFKDKIIQSINLVR